MATDDTKLIISLELILKNLDRTLKGLSQVEKQLKAVSAVKLTATANTNFDKATVAAQKLTIQQNKLAVQAQELANRQERARQTTERLALAQDRLAASSARQANASQQAATQVARIEANTARQAAQQEALRTRAAKTISDVQVREAQRGADALVNSLGRQQKASDQFNKTIQSVGNSLRSIGQGLSTLGIGLTAALTAPLVALGTTSVRAAVSLDSLKRGLTAIVGSSEEASRQLARLTEIAKLPGIGFEEAIQGSIRLQAVGFSAAEAEKSLVQFANAIALTGGGRAELERVTIQLGQLAAKGKVLSQDLRPIIEAAPAVGRALLQAFGTVNADDIQELGLSSKEFLNTLTKQLEQLPRAAAGARNAFENFRDTVFRASAAIGDELLPVLSRLIEVAAPVITRLAEGFKALPKPVQDVVVVLGAFAAALGPVLFVFGQLTTGVGRLIVGFAQLSAVGLGQVIKNLRLLATGALAAAEAETTLAAANATLTASFVGIGLVIAAATAIYLAFRSSQKEAIQLSKDQVDAQEAVISGLESQVKFLTELSTGVKRTTEEQAGLNEIYNSLNVSAQARVTGISDEEKRLAALRGELEKVLQLKQQEQAQGAANLAGSLATTLQQVAANEKEIESNVRRVQANAALADEIRRTNTITAEQSRQLARQGINAAIVEEALGALQNESENLVTTNQDLRKTTDELNGTAKEQAATLATLEQQTGLTARQLLLAAKNMGVFRGDVEQTLEQLKLYTQGTVEATNATRTFNDVLKEQSSGLIKAGDEAEEAEKRRRKLISSAAALAQEASNSFEGALKFFRAFIAANPELSEAVRKQAQVQQKTIDEFLRQTLGGKDKSGTALRNAQEQLQKAITALVKAEGDKRVAEEQANNEILLRANESAFKQQLISYREYLQNRAVLTDSALAKEAEAQGELIKQAREAQIRLLKQAQDQRLPATERTRRQAQAKESEAAAVEAERKLVEIQSRRKALTDEVNFSLAEAAVRQLEDVRKLEIEYAQLTGRIEEALNAATDEKFRETLLGLVQTQEKLNQELVKAKQEADAERVAQIEAAKVLNQRQIDTINGIIDQERATNQLQAAEEFVTQAKQAQADLEKQIADDVNFRGLREEEAIRRRLAGEEQVKNALLIARDIIQSTIDRLDKAGFKPPKALTDFVREAELAAQSLGKLDFTTQFRLAEKEFNRVNDERLRKIADIERAVRRGAIAEIQGLIEIKRVNGEYVGELERRLKVLEDIAAKSGDQGLIQQTDAAREATKDANDQLTDFNAKLRSTSIDALKEGFTQFFVDLTDSTRTAKDALLDFLNSISRRITDLIADELGKRLIESLFPDPGAVGGSLIDRVKQLLGLGGGGGEQPGGLLGKEAAGAVTGTGLDAAATAAAATLQTGAVTAAATDTAAAATAAATTTTAAASLAASIATSAAGFTTAVAAAGASFTAAVAAAATAFAAAVTASSTVQGAGGALGSIGGQATGDILPAQPGGRIVRVAEAGHAEAVLTTDPRHAARQARLLNKFLKATRGLQGRFQVPDLAQGAFITPREAEARMLGSITRAGSIDPRSAQGLTNAAAGGTTRLRQVLVDERNVGDWLNSSEGEKVFMDKLIRNRPVIRNLAR